MVVSKVYMLTITVACVLLLSAGPSGARRVPTQTRVREGDGPPPPPPTATHTRKGKAPTGTINDVEHIVIFMQENRAFDHYYGKMQGVRGFNDRTAITLKDGKSVWYQPTKLPTCDYELPWHMDFTKTNGVCGEAPEMNYPTDIAMWNSGSMDAWNTARDPGLGMSYLEATDLPYYYSLSEGFTLADQYFQSTFTETNPNRLHLFSGSNGLSVGHYAVLNNDEPNPGWKWETMAETLEKANVSWVLLQETDNFDDNGFAWFDTFQKAKPGSTYYDKGMYRSGNLVDEFSNFVKNGSLPQVTWIVGPTNASEHANHRPPYGERLSSQLIQVLQDNPDVYAKTVFILNYDEGGQFFDHATPPTPPTSAGDGISTVSVEGELTPQNLPIGLGFRVPAFAISPWSRCKGGCINSEVFDHTSTIQFIEKRFNVHCPNISPWRRAVTGDFTSMFDFTKPDYTWPTLPDTSKYIAEADYECAHLPPPSVPEQQKMPTQYPGTRVSRPLPYATDASVAYDASALNNTSLHISNTGQAAVVIHAYDMKHLGTPPRKYTVEAGKAIRDPLLPAEASGAYDWVMHGPNGWVRRYTNTGVLPAATLPSVQLTLSYTSDVKYTVTVKNPSTTQTLSVDLTWNDYQNVTSSGHTVAPGASLQLPGSLPTHRWYDISVSINPSANTTSTAACTARFMGRMENGQPSITDPGSPSTGLNPFSIPDDQHPLIPKELRAFSGIQHWLHRGTDPMKCIARHLKQK
eukprot:TRINITY_DN17108_c0_g1_i1.p1 TRINITY_DN17108_c0_g1~~TRINITY_DN17108_c0_g1_i1.p1  ORF type:complete len:746 (+),score=151.01 TRINITY_DN17108_c0_g1_i1:2-2239(+)